jgi:ElaB/YqjD/DUF883 family membrane-anchored ribosome-binding protein
MPDQRNELTTEKSSDRRQFVPIASARIEEVKTDVKNAGNALLEQAKSTAGDAYGKISEKANTALDEKKAGLTGGLSSVADSIRTAADSLGKNADQNHVTRYSAQYANTAAQKLEQTANYFENNDLKAMARDAENFARRNPAIFLGGAFVLGVLAARFFKSSPVPSLPAKTGAAFETAAGGF